MFANVRRKHIVHTLDTLILLVRVEAYPLFPALFSCFLQHELFELAGGKQVRQSHRIRSETAGIND